MKEKPQALRDVRACHIGQIVKVRGIITRCTDVKPLMQVAVYTCEECGFEIYQVIFWPSLISFAGIDLTFVFRMKLPSLKNTDQNLDLFWLAIYYKGNKF
mgnify:CR=1 FL=1